MRIIGVDPGLTGAIAILDGNKVINLFEMPVMAEGKKNKRQLNSAQLVSIIKENIKNWNYRFFLLDHLNGKNTSNLLILQRTQVEQR